MTKIELLAIMAAIIFAGSSDEDKSLNTDDRYPFEFASAKARDLLKAVEDGNWQ